LNEKHPPVRVGQGTNRKPTVEAAQKSVDALHKYRSLGHEQLRKNIAQRGQLKRV
jgi:hypothetical protein